MSVNVVGSGFALGMSLAKCQFDDRMRAREATMERLTSYVRDNAVFTSLRVATPDLLTWLELGSILLSFMFHMQMAMKAMSVGCNPGP